MAERGQLLPQTQKATEQLSDAYLQSPHRNQVTGNNNSPGFCPSKLVSCQSGEVMGTQRKKADLKELRVVVQLRSGSEGRQMSTLWVGVHMPGPWQLRHQLLWLSSSPHPPFHAFQVPGPVSGIGSKTESLASRNLDSGGPSRG